MTNAANSTLNSIPQQANRRRAGNSVRYGRKARYTV